MILAGGGEVCGEPRPLFLYESKKMNKFYVKSGDLMVVVLAESHRKAVDRALEGIGSYSDAPDTLRLGCLFDVNERGFESPPDISFDTEKMIDESDWSWLDE